MLILHGLLISVVKSGPFSIWVAHSQSGKAQGYLFNAVRTQLRTWKMSPSNFFPCMYKMWKMSHSLSICEKPVGHKHVCFVCVCACSWVVSVWLLVGLHRCSHTERSILLSRLMSAWLIRMCKCLYERGVQGHSSLLSIILIKPNFPQRLYRQLF